MLLDWDPLPTSGITRSTLALRYLGHRERDAEVLLKLVNQRFWTDTQDIVRERGADWLSFDKEGLLGAQAAFGKEAGIQDFDDWSALERDDVEVPEARALWDALHAAQARGWRSDEALVAEHAHKVRLYPDLPFQRKRIWELLDSVAESQYVFVRKQAVLFASKGTPSDFGAARFTYLPSYADIAKAVHKERPQDTSSALVSYAWGMYRTFRASNTDRRRFGSALRKSISAHLPHVPVDEMQSRKAKARRVH